MTLQFLTKNLVNLEEKLPIYSCKAKSDFYHRDREGEGGCTPPHKVKYF